jgi:hypothetical protein
MPPHGEIAAWVAELVGDGAPVPGEMSLLRRLVEQVRLRRGSSPTMASHSSMQGYNRTEARIAGRLSAVRIIEADSDAMLTAGHHDAPPSAIRNHFSVGCSGIGSSFDRAGDVSLHDIRPQER